MMLMKSRINDTNASYNERGGAIVLYFKVMVKTERLKGKKYDLQILLDDLQEMKRPIISKIVGEAISELSKRE